MIDLNQTNYTEILNFFFKKLGYGYHCVLCNRRAKIIQAIRGTTARDWVSWECPNCKKRWNYEFKNKEIRKLLK